MLRRRWQVMLGQQRPKGSMFQMVTIEELVPKDHFLRQLDAAVDFSFIRERVRHLYCEDNVRPSIEPALALPMFVLSYLYDITENRLCEEITMQAGYRWFRSEERRVGKELRFRCLW